MTTATATKTATKSRARVEILSALEAEGRIVFRHSTGRLTVKASVVALRPVAGGFDLIVQSDRSVPYGFVPQALAAHVEALGVEMLEASGASAETRGWKRGAFQVRKASEVAWVCGMVRRSFGIYDTEDAIHVGRGGRWSLTELRTGLACGWHKTAALAKAAALEAESDPAMVAQIAAAVAANALPEDENEAPAPFVSTAVEPVAAEVVEAPTVARMSQEDAAIVARQSLDIAEGAEVLLSVVGAAIVPGRLCLWVVGTEGPAMLGRGFRWSEDAGAWYRPLEVVDFEPREVRALRLPVAAMAVKVLEPLPVNVEPVTEGPSCRWCSEAPDDPHSNGCPLGERYAECQRRGGVPLPKMTIEEAIAFVAA